MEDYKRKVEAVLFASGKFLEINRIAEMLNLGSVGIIKETIKELKEEYGRKESAIEILEQGNKDSTVPILRRICQYCDGIIGFPNKEEYEKWELSE